MRYINPLVSKRPDKNSGNQRAQRTKSNRSRGPKGPLAFVICVLDKVSHEMKVLAYMSKAFSCSGEKSSSSSFCNIIVKLI